MFFSNCGLIAYFNDGTKVGCERCDFIKSNIERMFKKKPFEYYSNDEILNEIKENGKEGWALVDYKWNMKVPIEQNNETSLRIDTITYVNKTTKKNYEIITLPNVIFKTNKDVLLPSSAEDLQQLAENLLENENLTAEIIGHTDNVGKPESNKALSQKRAESIKRFLVSLGVNDSRLNAVGMCDTQPKSSNDSEEGRLMNRRVEVKLSKTEKIETKREKVDAKTPELKPAKTKKP